MFQRDEDVGVHAADVVGRHKGQVEENRHAQHVIDRRYLFGRNDLADLLLDGEHQLFRFLDAHAHRRAEMQLEDTDVGSREEVGSHHPAKQNADAAHQQQTHQHEGAVAHDDRQDGAVRVLQPFQRILSGAIQSRGGALAGPVIMMFSCQQLAGKHGHQRKRQNVGCKQGEHHGQRERNEQEFRNAIEESDRDKHDADCQGGHRARHRHFAGPFQDRDRERLPHRAVPVNVFHGYRRVVDQDTGCERQAGQRHQVDRIAGEIKAEDAGRHRARNRGDHDDGIAPRTEEQQDHQRHQKRCNNCFGSDVLDRRAHVNRLVEIKPDLDALRRGLLDFRQHVAGGLHHRERRSFGVLQDGKVSRAPAIDVDDVVLHGIAVRDFRHVAQQDRHSIRDAQRHLVELVHRRRARVHGYVVFRRTDTRRTGWNQNVRTLQSTDDVVRRNALRCHQLRIQVHHDLAQAAAERRRHGQPGDGEQLYAHEVERVVENAALGNGLA